MACRGDRTGKAAITMNVRLKLDPRPGRADRSGFSDIRRCCKQRRRHSSEIARPCCSIEGIGSSASRIGCGGRQRADNEQRFQSAIRYSDGSFHGRRDERRCLQASSTPASQLQERASQASARGYRVAIERLAEQCRGTGAAKQPCHDFDDRFRVEQAP